MTYCDVEAGKRWWIETFDCKQVKVPADWDEILPSDVALKLPGEENPAICLSAKSEVEARNLNRSSAKVPIIFSGNLKKAYEHMASRGVSAAMIQEDGETRFFEIRDLESNILEICEEP